MGEVRAFAVVTLQGAGLSGVNVTLVATPSTFSASTDEVTLLAYTDPSSWLRKIRNLQASDPGATFRGGQTIIEQKEEDYQLTTTAPSIKAEGSVGFPVKLGTFDPSSYGGIGDSFLIENAQAGTKIIRTRGIATAACGRVRYETEARRWIITGMTRPIVIVAGTLIDD